PAGEGEEGPAHGPMAYARVSMELGQYYLLSGEYSRAAELFLQAAQVERPEHPRAERRERQMERRAERLESDEDGGPERGHRRHRGMRGRRGHGAGQMGEGRAYVMAAVATQLSGDPEGALVIAEEGLAQCERCSEAADTEEGEGRPHRNPLNEFIEDPDGFSARFAGGVNALEERLLEIEAQLGESE
ncbi:MAG: hypothetical protein KC561_09715, partial [Myxococcales bacterium]|nr:hypothetical protein [Myxococcales bacterium]